MSQLRGRTETVAQPLSIDTVGSFLTMHFPDDDSAQKQARLEDFRLRFESGERSYNDFILILHGDQAIWSFQIFPDGTTGYGVQTPKHLPVVAINEQDWQTGVALVSARLEKLMASKATLRFTTSVHQEE